MMHDYMIQKEAKGWSVWTCAPATGDKRDYLSQHNTKRQALSAIDRLRTISRPEDRS